MNPLRVGDLLRDCIEFGPFDGAPPDYRVEAVGADWVVARRVDGRGKPELYYGCPEGLISYAEWWLHAPDED